MLLPSFIFSIEPKWGDSNAQQRLYNPLNYKLEYYIIYITNLNAMERKYE